MFEFQLLDDKHSSSLTNSEMAWACCDIAREQLEIGDFDAGCNALKTWWNLGGWPKLEGLSETAAGELLLIAGTLTGWIAGVRHINGGQRGAEGLLSAALAFFERLDDGLRASEARVELAYCYFREGLFELARDLLILTLGGLPDSAKELKAVASIRLAIVDRHAGRLHDALASLKRANEFVTSCKPLIRGRFHHELATTLKEVAVSDGLADYLEQAFLHYGEALREFETIGNRRYVASVENNHGHLLSTLGRFEEAKRHLERARLLFDDFGDVVSRAQVDETLAQVHLAANRCNVARQAANLAVQTLENSGEEALLAEALTTQGLVFCKLGKRHEAKPVLQRAQRVAERCGDNEGAGKALLIIVEEMSEHLGDDELREIGGRLNQLLANSQQKSIRERLRAALERIAAAHAAFEQQREKAAHAEKLAALGELSFGVAHNVNNTLTGILGRAQLLLRISKDQKLSSGLETIIKSAEDGAHIIRRIQDFARKTPSREFQSLSVTQLMRDVAEMSRPRWEARADAPPIRLAIIADCTASVVGDPVELREVLVNMIYNAVDAMPEGGKICLSAQETEGRVRLTITDTGSGMTAEIKSRLFDPFFTTKGKRGTGMGLAVSFGIIRRHKGSIEVESEPGHGTAFVISLPVAQDANTETGEKVASAAPAPSERTRILVVDDELPVREILREALEVEGFEVHVTESGEEALRVYDDCGGRIDVVFTDIGMPDMDGWELAREIRKRSETIPLAIVSGWGDSIGHDARQAVKAEWVVSKPFDIDAIAAIAREVAGRKKRA